VFSERVTAASLTAKHAKFHHAKTANEDGKQSGKLRVNLKQQVLSRFWMNDTTAFFTSLMALLTTKKSQKKDDCRRSSLFYG
jgi:hypothetical protein